ncbi:SIFamide precursor [Bombyx mori]|uniref:SIFamide n=1 Tax=Bombyx mori TaxID=7091 RepID=B3IUC7_BOMMO|nr:SIFamide precursor [Bombyx mori]XP_037877244.1 neuropeptide SIFamide-like [Bombyx mori]BAG50362.1 SIFamide [Bombyx mori]
MRADLIYFMFLVIILTLATIEATYRKPPFNGSIFGKRNNVENDSSGRAIAALCEITTETCQAWYQALESQ